MPVRHARTQSLTPPAAPVATRHVGRCPGLVDDDEPLGVETAADYKYSAAMKKSGLTWTAGALDTYLAAPKATVAGTKMTYAGVKDATKRSDIVTYLATLK